MPDTFEQEKKKIVGDPSNPYSMGQGYSPYDILQKPSASTSMKAPAFIRAVPGMNEITPYTSGDVASKYSDYESMFGPPTADRAREDIIKSAAEAKPSDQQMEDIRQKQYEAMLAAAEQARTGGTQAQTAELQKQYAQMLMDRIQGKTASPIQEQLKQALEMQQRQTASQIASQRGMNPALAARLLVQQQTQQGQAIAGKAAEAKLAEQQQLEQQYAAAIGQMRGQDIEATSRQTDALARMQEAIRTGDQNALNASIQALVNVRQGDIQLSDQQRLERQQYVEQQTAAARMAHEKELQRIKGEEDRLTITAAEAEKQRQKANEDLYRWLATIAIVAGAAGAIIATGGAATAAVLPAAGALVGTTWATRRSAGGKIKGKATVKGDHEKNDTVPALLSPGEIVIPRSIAESPNAAEQSKRFVSAIQNMEKGSKLSKKDASERIAKLEAELAALKAARKESRR